MQEAILTLTNITKSFGSKDILRGIDLTVSSGEIFKNIRHIIVL